MPTKFQCIDAVNWGLCKAEGVFLMGADPATAIAVGHRVLRAPSGALPEFRPKAEDGLRCPLFQLKNVYFAYFYKALSQEVKSTTCRPTISRTAIWTQ